MGLSSTSHAAAVTPRTPPPSAAREGIAGRLRTDASEIMKTPPSIVTEGGGGGACAGCAAGVAHGGRSRTGGEASSLPPWLAPRGQPGGSRGFLMVRWRALLVEDVETIDRVAVENAFASVSVQARRALEEEVLISSPGSLHGAENAKPDVPLPFTPVYLNPRGPVPATLKVPTAASTCSSSLLCFLKPRRLCNARSCRSICTACSCRSQGEDAFELALSDSLLSNMSACEFVCPSCSAEVITLSHEVLLLFTSSIVVVSLLRMQSHRGS